MPSKIWVKVKAQAREESITQLSAANYQVSVSAPREKGKANQAVIVLLAEYFSVPKSQIKILCGYGAKIKLVEIG
jgi:uncharacterized protein YggU (UPF0235/DUF167 family)